MSPKYTETLQQLRQQRGLLDQAITALEIISGERPLPELLGSESVQDAVARPAPQLARRQKLLSPAKPAKRKYTRKADVEATTPASERQSTAATVEEAAILAIVRAAGGTITPRELMTRLKLTRMSTMRARTAPLLKSRRLIAIGATHNRRLALPESAKEAP